MSGLSVLICGLGSIGRRHMRQLRELGASRVDAYRTGRATLSDDGQQRPDRVFTSLPEALAQSPDVVVVSNPTSLHIETALAAVRSGAHVLVEKPLSHSLEGVERLAAEARTRQRVVWVGCNLRFHPILSRLRALVGAPETLGAPTLARFHFGADLPSWHPWEDYRSSYAARSELGGGVGLTHIHEIDAALWLFGAAEKVRGLALPARPLGTDVAEAGGLLIAHRSGALSSVTLSFLQRPPSRTVEVAFRDGMFFGDLDGARWRIRRASGREEEGVDAGFEWDRTYREQAAAFVAAVKGEGPVSVPIEDGIAALQAALAMEAA